MSRDGLREENLRSKKEKRITRREADEKKTAGHREQELDFGKARKAHTAEEPVEEGTEGKHRLQSRHAFLEQEKIAEADEMENSEMSEDKADGEKSPSVSRSRLRKESIRGHPGQDAERDSETPEPDRQSRKKKMVTAYAAKEQKRYHEKSEVDEKSMEDFREEIKGKTKREQTLKEQKKSKSRLSFQFDVYYGDHASASAHGHQTWEAYIADSNGSQEVEVTTTREVNRLDVTLTNHNLDAVLRNRMTDKEQEQYDAYNKYYGNRDYLFDLNSIPTGGAGFGYDIPAEALSDPQFAKMIREAEKYLGYPYVWGGASPSTSFDCSGFVCWVINNCGNGWNVGRTTADGLRSYCSYVSPSDAKPGDLIFFQGTYDTPGASHVGIYVGNNMMIHCGNPIQYTSIASSYWQQHFMAFGRLH